MGLRAWVKGFTVNKIEGASGVIVPSSTFDYAAHVKVDANSAVMAAVNWYTRTYPEAPIVVQAPDEDGVMEIDHGHEVARLLRRPNPAYSGALMRMAMVADFIVTGNAYYQKVRSESGRNVLELWWAPSWTMTPKRNPPVPGKPPSFLDYYEYSPAGGVMERWEPEDIIHFRNGLDPSNPMLGLSPLASLLREIFTDDEASRFTATILRNLAIPGVILSPEGSIAASTDNLEEVKDKWRDAFSGDRRGDVMVMRGATKVQTLSWSPKQLQLRDIRRIPEERITAVLGIAAVVVGLGAGLDRSTFNNMTEAREMAYESGLIPMQSLHADDLTIQLLPDFDNRPDALVAFDYRGVRVLQEDETALVERWKTAVQGSIAKRSEARAALGLDVKPEDDVYLIPISVMEIGPGADPLTLIGGRTLVPADEEGNPIEDEKVLALEEPGVNGEAE